MNFAAKFHLLASVGKPRFFGFFQGHTALTDEELGTVEQFVDTAEHPGLENQFESGFSKILGGGKAISFAAGRMAFYAALKAFGIGAGDEVLLTGFTCAVMSNAVWRTGATPRYADISGETLGTDPADVLRKLNSRSRMIVVQHTFGLPCQIEALTAIARERHLPLIEDCALTLGSQRNGQTMGLHGDAAIFSTDHSKPLNTLIGGLLVTRNRELAAKVRAIQQAAPPLGAAQQRRLWRRLLLERKYFKPSAFGRGRAVAAAANLPRKLRERFSRRDEPVFLDADFKPRLKPDAYPYPARLPAFLAQVGLFELARWPGVATHRRSVIGRLLEAAPASVRSLIPSGYFDPRNEVVPLRLAYEHPQAAEIERRMRAAVDLDYVWFREPVVFATQGPASFNYQPGECPVAERIGRHIINWPCDVPESDMPRFIELFAECHKGL